MQAHSFDFFSFLVHDLLSRAPKSRVLYTRIIGFPFLELLLLSSSVWEEYLRGGSSTCSDTGIIECIFCVVDIADVCTNKDISITQSRDGSVGIPQYTVQIVNTCMSECAPSDIHVYCGWFASSPPPNPNTFTRVAYNDCLVNGGRALPHGSVIQFQYANSFMYPLRFKSANFCR